MFYSALTCVTVTGKVFALIEGTDDWSAECCPLSCIVISLVVGAKPDTRTVLQFWLSFFFLVNDEKNNVFSEVRKSTINKMFCVDFALNDVKLINSKWLLYSMCSFLIESSDISPPVLMFNSSIIVCTTATNIFFC